MNNLIIVIGIPLLFTSFFSVTAVPKWLDFRPFNCIVCLSFWIVLAALILNQWQPNIVYIAYIAYAGIAAYIAQIAKRLLFKI